MNSFFVLSYHSKEETLEEREQKDAELRSKLFKSVVNRQVNLLFMANTLKIPITLSEIGEMEFPEFIYINDLVEQRFDALQQKQDELDTATHANNQGNRPPSANHLNYG